MSREPRTLLTVAMTDSRGRSRAISAPEEEARTAAAAQFVDAVVKEVEPLLADAAPFFGGSSKLTLAEVRGRGKKRDGRPLMSTAKSWWRGVCNAISLAGIYFTTLASAFI
jgi:hypothetical protein